MKIISMIPARYAASRFPGKLMQQLHDKTVILHTYQAVVNTRLFDDVFVVTDSDMIYNEIINHGGNAIKSTKEYACGSDRIAAAAQTIDADIIVNVQGDEPFTTTESLSSLLETFKGADASAIDLASLMTEINEEKEINNPNTVKVIVDNHNFALYFSRLPIPYNRDKDTTTVRYFKHKGVYAFRKRALIDFYQLPMLPLEAAEKIECLRYLEYGRKIKMVETQSTGIEIDTPEDLEQAKKIWK